MAAFDFEERIPVPPGSVVAAQLGPDANTKFGDNDRGKGVKLSTATKGAYIAVADGDEIEGIVVAIDQATVNGNCSFGSVQRAGQFRAKVADANGVALGAYVVAGPPVALGTAGTVTVKDGAPAKFLWRVVSLLGGTGADASTVLIERM